VNLFSFSVMLSEINSVRLPISTGNSPTTSVISLNREQLSDQSYISVTLPSTQVISLVSVQHAVGEIEGIPEFSISQSVAANVVAMSKHRAKGLSLERFPQNTEIKQGAEVGERLRRGIMLSTIK
jgi:hypothetical protein